MFVGSWSDYKNNVSTVAGDEVLAVNGQACHELAHVEALALFKAVRNGAIELRVCRRTKTAQ